MSDWIFENNAVESKERNPAAKQIGSKGVLIGFGPPKYKSKAKVVLCGFVQHLSLNQQKQVQELFEIGSGDRFYSDGPTRNMLSIARALFSGASLLKMIGSGMTGKGVDGDAPEGLDDSIFDAGSNASNAAATNFDDAHWMNLSSSFFNNPMGILLRYGSFDGAGNYETYSSTYLENAKLQSLSTSVQAGQWLTQEQVQIMFARPVPVSGKTIDKYYENRDELIGKIHDGDTDVEKDEQNFDTLD